MDGEDVCNRSTLSGLLEISKHIRARAQGVINVSESKATPACAHT